VDFTQPHIFVLNHQSMADICVGFVAIPVGLRFVAKKALAFVPFLGWYMWATGMVFVDRGNSRQAIRSLNKAGEQIRAGANIIAFPEGTRSTDGVIKPFKKGIFVVALNSGVPIVPVAIEGAHRVLPPGGLHLRPGLVRARIGRPIPTAGYTKADLEVLVRDVRSNLIALHRDIGGAGGDPERAVAPRQQHHHNGVPHPS
ncbi:MAG: acyltransferase, partial [Deltaproteobacteria bacterium RIFOXYB12_FULL_58_9]